MNKLMFRVQVMEDTFYLGKRDIVEYFYPDAFQKKYDNDVALLYQETRKKTIECNSTNGVRCAINMQSNILHGYI
ncbi:MAG: hypothetical protein K2O15_14985 [Lachnospiraceae bacterium]|nr:hypothetical protein [Lachnospiraceae bacterium]